KLRLYVIGYEPTRPGGPPEVIDGRGIARSHYEMVADGSTGLVVADRVPLGRHTFNEVGLTRHQVNSGGDPAVYSTLAAAQKLQFDLAPPAARVQLARGDGGASRNTVNAVVARLHPNASPDAVAATVQRWKHLSAITQEAQELILTRS